MSVRVHDSIRIRIGRPDLTQFKGPKTVVVDPCKSPSELIFFREAFKLIDSKRGSNLKSQYTNLVGGYQRGIIPWSCLSGFHRGYKAAVERVCYLLDDLFRTDELDSPAQISLLADYAFKVYSFRTYRSQFPENLSKTTKNHDFRNDPKPFRLTEVNRREHSNWGHRGACNIWRTAYYRLKSLENSVSVFCIKKGFKPQPAPIKSTGAKVEPQPKPTTIVSQPDPSITPQPGITADSEKPKEVQDGGKVSIWWRILSCICCLQPDEIEDE